MNILVNAAQAIEKQGEIRIVTRETAGFIEIVISDTGTGHPEGKYTESSTRFSPPKKSAKERVWG